MEAKVRTKAEAARARAEAEAKAAVERDALARFEAEVKAAASLAATNRVELIGKGMQRAGFKRESVIKTLTQGHTRFSCRALVNPHRSSAARSSGRNRSTITDKAGSFMTSS